MKTQESVEAPTSPVSPIVKWWEREKKKESKGLPSLKQGFKINLR